MRTLSTLFLIAGLAFAGDLGTPTQSKKVLSLAGAKAVASGAVAEARRLNAPGGSIAIVDDGGNLVYLERLDNSFAASAPVAIEKARTAAQFQRPTADFENAIKNGRTSLLGVQLMTPLQGGIPIKVDGQIVGAIGVSGAASADQDTELAKAGAAVMNE